MLTRRFSLTTAAAQAIPALGHRTFAPVQNHLDTAKLQPNDCGILVVIVKKQHFCSCYMYLYYNKIAPYKQKSCRVLCGILWHSFYLGYFDTNFCNSEHHWSYEVLPFVALVGSIPIELQICLSHAFRSPATQFFIVPSDK